MTTLNVQFTDSSESIIQSYFGNPQDETVYPNQGTVLSSDARWKAFVASMPALVQSELPAPD